MKKSALQVARAAYQPKMPKALYGNNEVEVGEPTESVADQEEVQKLFPNTYGMPILKFVESVKATEYPAINVGVILSGGQAPGGHNVIAGLYDGIKKLNIDSKLYGFLIGPGRIGRSPIYAAHRQHYRRIPQHGRLRYHWFRTHKIGESRTI